MDGVDRTVRNLRIEDLGDALRCIRTAFLDGKDVTDEHVEWVATRWDLTRTWGAFEDGELCGTTRTFGTRLRLPGLDDVPVSCLTSVTVLPTATRRGHLTRMMRAQLDAAVEAGEVASLLIAAEWPIYGRYGYGPATEWVEWEVDASLASVTGEASGSWRLVDAAELDKAVAFVLERQQALTPGSFERPAWYRAIIAGVDPRPWEKHEGRVRAVHLDDAGEPDAYVMYDPKERWEGMRPSTRVDVADAGAVSPAAERELWRYLVEIDLVRTIRWGGSPSSVLPYVLVDGRAAKQTGRWDQVWARLLDVEACLSARRYVRPGRVVIDVVDDSFGAAAGRYVLEADSSGEGRCSRVGGSGGAGADVTADVSVLGAAWLGGTDVRALAAGGGRWAVEEHRPGAVDELAALLRWPEPPWCATDF